MNNKRKETLLLNQFSTIISDPTSSEVISMFNYIQSKISRNNKIPFHVIRRFSGTQGLTVPDRDFYQYIKHSGLLPKTTTGCKIIKERNVWKIYYNNIVKNNNEFIRKPCLYVMSQPRVGGNVHITRDISNKFSWITDFAETKFICVILLEAINDRYRRKIEPLAIQTTL